MVLLRFVLGRRSEETHAQHFGRPQSLDISRSEPCDVIARYSQAAHLHTHGAGGAHSDLAAARPSTLARPT